METRVQRRMNWREIDSHNLHVMSSVCLMSMVWVRDGQIPLGQDRLNRRVYRVHESPLVSRLSVSTFLLITFRVYRERVRVDG